MRPLGRRRGRTITLHIIIIIVIVAVVNTRATRREETAAAAAAKGMPSFFQSGPQIGRAVYLNQYRWAGRRRRRRVCRVRAYGKRATSCVPLPTGAARLPHFVYQRVGEHRSRVR